MTTDIGLLDAIKQINPGPGRVADDTMARPGIGNPGIGVCGINPHAGANRPLGYGEEKENIMSAVRRGAGEGIAVQGRLPADPRFDRTVPSAYRHLGAQRISCAR